MIEKIGFNARKLQHLTVNLTKIKLSSGNYKVTEVLSQKQTLNGTEANQ